MFYLVETPDDLHGAALDNYLSKGWYRMGQTIFTTNFVEHGIHVYPAHWIRYNLQKFKRTKKQDQLTRKNNIFDVVAKPLVLNAELEILYSKYRQYIRFNAALSVKDNLMYMHPGDDHTSIYDSWVMELREGSKLIAAGVFDKGLNTMAGIKTFYDPAYAKYSPGKYLLLRKIEYAIAHKADYFYPGYIAEVYTKFHYKMEAAPDTLEIYSTENDAWTPFQIQEFINRNN